MARREQHTGTFDVREHAVRATVEATHYWHVHRRAVLLDELRRFVPAARAPRMIEIGCGVGTVATHLNAHGYTVDYADVFPEALALAQEGARARLGDASARSFLEIDLTAEVPRLTQGGALLLDVIEHLPDDVGALGRVRDALASARDAFVVITVPAFDFLWSPWDDVERHKRRYTRKSLERTLARAGLAPVRTTYFFGALFFAALAMKGARGARATFTGQREVERAEELFEMRSIPPLDRMMLGLLAPERALLSRGSLPFGTSLLTIARAAP